MIRKESCAYPICAGEERKRPDSHRKSDICLWPFGSTRKSEVTIHF